MSGNRSSSATIRARVDIVYRLLLLGLDRQRIIDHVHKKYPAWPKSDGAIDRYIKQADQLLIGAGEHDRPVELGRAVARLHDLYSLARTDKNVRDALAVVKEIIELRGLRAPIEVNVNDARRELVELMLEEVMREAEEATAGAAQAD